MNRIKRSSDVKIRPRSQQKVTYSNDIEELPGKNKSCALPTPTLGSKSIKRSLIGLQLYADEKEAKEKGLAVQGQSVIKPSKSSKNKLPAEDDKRKSPVKTICLDGCRYDVVRRIAMELGFREVPENEYWNILWTDAPISLDKALDMRRLQVIIHEFALATYAVSPSALHFLQESHKMFWGPILNMQKTNHFPGMHEICRKDRLARNLNRMKKIFDDEYSFFPQTWTLPADVSDLLRHHRTTKNPTYICKPDSGCQGKGIFLVRNLKKINPFAKLIAQVYIPNPLLIDGYKFDLRIYILITSCDPLRVHVYNEGIARFATVKYAPPNEQNTDVVFMHLTNYSLNKFSQSYMPEPEGSKRKLSTIYGYLVEKGFNVEKMIEDIDDVIIKTVIAAQPTLRHYYRASFPNNERGSACFEILGFDILIDEDLKPWLLEVNLSPSFNLDLEVDAEIKETLLRDTFNKIYLGTAKDKLVPDMPPPPKKGIVNLSPRGQVEIVDKAGNQIPNYLQKQFYHEQLNQGNFRLVYPCDNCAKYSQLLDPNLNLATVADLALTGSRRTWLFDRFANDTEEIVYRKSTPVKNYHKKLKSGISSIHHVEATPEGQNSTKLDILRTDAMAEGILSEVIKISDMLSKKQKLSGLAGESNSKKKNMVELKSDDSGSSIIVNQSDGLTPVSPKDFHQTESQGKSIAPNHDSILHTQNFSASPNKWALPPLPTNDVDMRRSKSRHRQKEETSYSPTREKLESHGHVLEGVIPARTNQRVDKTKFIQDWILIGGMESEENIPRRKKENKSTETETETRIQKRGNFSQDAMKPPIPPPERRHNTERRKTASSAPFPSYVLACEEHERKEMLDEREKAIRQLGIEGKSGIPDIPTDEKHGKIKHGGRNRLQQDILRGGVRSKYVRKVNTAGSTVPLRRCSTAPPLKIKKVKKTKAC